MSLKCRKTVRRPTSALTATCSALGAISPDWTISSMAATMRARLSSPRRRRPSDEPTGSATFTSARSVTRSHPPSHNW